MADMGEVGMAGGDFGDDVEGFREREVGYVGFGTQGVYYKGVYAFYRVDGFCGYVFGIGDIRHIADAETHDFEFVMVYRQGEDFYAVNVEWGERGDCMKGEVRYAGICFRSEGIGHAFAEVALNIGLAVDWKVNAVFAIGAQVVHSSHMVVMLVGNQQRRQVQVARHHQHLVIEIGAAVDEQIDAVGTFYEYRGPQTLVAVVGRDACRTAAAKLGYACGGPCAEECKFHLFGQCVGLDRDYFRGIPARGRLRLAM